MVSTNIYIYLCTNTEQILMLTNKKMEPQSFLFMTGILFYRHIKHSM